jgi:VCBS repeat-containing protein
VLAVADPGTYAGAYGTLTLAGDGGYDYVLDNGAVQSLAEGQSVVDRFDYHASDGSESVAGSLAVTIAGTNDAPQAIDLYATAGEDGPAVALVPEYTDVDTGDTHVVTVGRLGNAGFERGDFLGWALSDAALGEIAAGDAPEGERYASLSTGAGQDEYTTLARLVTLGEGELLTGFADFIAGDELPYDDDAYVSIRMVGGATTYLFNASVGSVGDYGESGWASWDFVAPEAGTYILEAGVRNFGDNGADSRLLLDGIEQLTPAPGVTLAADNSIEYDPGGRFEWLAEGESVADFFSYTVTDAHGAQSVAAGAVEVTGANDAPLFGAGDLAGGVLEDNALPASASLEASGLIEFGDVDLSDAHVVAASALGTGYLGEFATWLIADSTGGATGALAWSFATDNGALDALGAGETLEQSYEVTVDDGHAGGTDARTVTIALSGVNDAPVTADDAGAVQEDTVLEAEGNVLGNDYDVDAHDVLTVADPGTYAGAWGSLALAADGGYRYTLDNDLAQSLAEGQEVEDVFTYLATDGVASTAAELTITVRGVNDAPVTVDDAASVQEDGILIASGNVLANDSDIDSIDVLSVGDPGIYGALSLALDGSYVYTLANESDAVQGLRAGQTVTDVFGYEATDGIASTPGTLTVTITGANDAPVANPDTGAAQEDGGPVTLSSAMLLANDLDVDVGDTKAIVAVSGSAAGAAVSLSAGDVIYDVGGLFQSLREGATATDTFDYTMADAAGATSEATVTMTVTGVNDAPFVVTPIDDQTAAAGQAFSFTVAPETFADIDEGDVLTWSATLADGTDLPAWLSFDPETHTFLGTPPGGGAGGTDLDCGCDGETGGGTVTDSLDLRVVATDTAGASAEDVFTLAITGVSSGGIAPIIGTKGNDILTGTPGNDVFDGRAGYDRMAGGAGDDVYYVDRTGNKVDLVTENANEGYDTIYSSTDYTLTANLEELHLIGYGALEGRGNGLANILVGNSGNNRLYGEGGNDLLLDDAGNDVLDGGAGNDILDGGAGNDRLSGGIGNDLFVYTLGGGNDLVQDSGGQDAVRFGDGIVAGDVTVLRSGDHLVLRLAELGGSVTLKDWFSSTAKRVEQVQFADGTVWDEAAMQAQVATGGTDGGSGGGWYGGDCGSWWTGSGGSNDSWSSGGGYHDDRDGHDDDKDRDDRLRDAIGARLARNAPYDFTALTMYLERENGGGYGATSAEDVAARWLAVQNCVTRLADRDAHCGDNDSGDGHGDFGGCGDDGTRSKWGYDGSTGQESGWGGMSTFSGLVEGYSKL